MPIDEIEIGMATLLGMGDQHKRKQINFECNKGEDYSYMTVEKLIKAAYSEIRRPSPFNSAYQNEICQPKECIKLSSVDRSWPILGFVLVLNRWSQSSRTTLTGLLYTKPVPADTANRRCGTEISHPTGLHQTGIPIRSHQITFTKLD